MILFKVCKSNVLKLVFFFILSAYKYMLYYTTISNFSKCIIMNLWCISFPNGHWIHLNQSPACRRAMVWAGRGEQFFFLFVYRMTHFWGRGEDSNLLAIPIQADSSVWGGWVGSWKDRLWTKYKHLLFPAKHILFIVLESSATCLPSSSCIKVFPGPNKTVRPSPNAPALSKCDIGPFGQHPFDKVDRNLTRIDSRKMKCRNVSAVRNSQKESMTLSWFMKWESHFEVLARLVGLLYVLK